MDNLYFTKFINPQILLLQHNSMLFHTDAFKRKQRNQNDQNATFEHSAYAKKPSHL